MEGISHEAISLAGHLRLSKLIVLFDDNGICIDGPVSLTETGDQLERFRAAGWNASRVDGHDMAAVCRALEEAQHAERPTLIACRTTIGFGAPNRQGTSGAHGAPLGSEEAKLAKAALGWKGKPFEVPSDIRDSWRIAGLRGVKMRKAWEKRLEAASADIRGEFERRMRGDLPSNFNDVIVAFKKQVIAEAKDPADLNRIIAERFDVYISIGCDDQGTVLYTGYCTPIFKGSLERSVEYRYPLYKRPADLEIKTHGTPMGRKTASGSIVPYYTRAEIDNNQLLAGKGLELVYLKDPLEVFIAHVQGSAIIELPDGTQRCAGYHGKTDRPYTSMGLSLVADGKIDRAALSLQKIMEYFQLHPHELKHYINKNESYVFFHWAESGPRGSLNTPVIPYRSIATDKAVFPRGLLTFLVTELPQMQTRDNVVFEPYYGFALDQDTGGAIRSAGRCDVYMGVGPDALLLAGRTNAEGKLYYLAVK